MDGTQINSEAAELQEAPASSEAPAIRRLPSLRTLVTLIVVFPIAAVAGALVLISIVSGRNIAEQLGRELVGETTDLVAFEVRRYFSDAVRVSDLYTRRILAGTLSTTDMASWERPMFDDLVTSQNVASICFGTPTGDATYLQQAHGRLELGISDGDNDCAAIEWPADASGKVDRQNPIRRYRYDPRLRPWYTAALQNDEPAWTDVYFWFGDVGSESETGTGYTRAIRDGSGKLLGVLTIDVTLSAISEFLKRQDFARSGAIFIIDDHGLQVAASEGRVNSIRGTRLTLAESDSPAARAVAALYPTLAPATPSQAHLATASAAAGAAGGQPEGTETAGPMRRIHVNGHPARVNYEVLRPYPGADWRIITVLPESAFLSQARATERRSILFGSFAIAAAIATGLVFSRRLSQPLLALTRHAARIGGGDLRSQLQLGGARELQQLAEETNRMAGGLRQRIELERSLEVATHVQQSLLPRCTPTLRGLEVAAHSRYCDSTGGDYYDFIDVTDLRDDCAFVAVGDVMGHGIGSALVMATARAAVRTCAQSRELSLGQLMARVNDVLSSDPHGLFMTLALLVVETQTARVRWASAGHDPVIVYDPARNDFFDLEGGDIPLGINSNYPFQDFVHEGIAPGWILFAGTDGVWEARDEQHEMYGKDRLRDVIRRNVTRSSEEIARCVERDLAKFVGRGPVLDDITFVVIKVVATADHPLA